MADMDLWTLLGDIIVLLAACLLLGGLFSRFGQSPLIGYLLAGMALGGRAVYRSWAQSTKSKRSRNWAWPCCFSVWASNSPSTD